MLLVTLVKMNLTTKKRKKNLSKFIVTLDNIQKEKVAK